MDDDQVDLTMAELKTSTSLNSSMCATVEENRELYKLLGLLAEHPDLQMNATNCSTLSKIEEDHTKVTALVVGSLFYAYFTPFVFVTGILGNSVSLSVFLCKSMRHLSASTYLAALSTSDLMVLIFYVLTEWLIRGVPVLSPDTKVTFMHVNGACQVIMYFHYVSRFLSAWLVVAFTVERYIGVCHPLHRRHICSPTSTKKIVFGFTVFSLVINIFKPLLSVVHDVELWGPMCTTYPQHRQLSFVLDSIYAVFITFIPFVIITVINILIIRRLVKHNRQQRLVRVVTEESVLRLEFTSILLVVSFCFVALNLPYFAIWCKLFLTSRFVNVQTFEDPDELDYFRGLALITRAIFCMNYCINFFLYSITGAYFRRQLRALFHYRSARYKQHSPCQGYCMHGSLQNSDSHSKNSLRRESVKSLRMTSTPQTWL
ncbi:cysteinyl leukotriene receptor 2 isoform X2 [Aplysia californica]|uniref:Cysteinyl leukotriene receptor 2 isoform X2 n=1 Tax=Aplysia californica TaxID=6500 RepID=A0ABM0JNT1_APLCA|nr:cysteinyl leukotriene receptor 2 isoform X2 [Aplysia californica]